MIEITLRGTRTGRMTTPQDVADAIVTCPATDRTSSAATSSGSTAASSSPAEYRP
jgi:hypothetical protein